MFFDITKSIAFHSTSICVQLIHDKDIIILAVNDSVIDFNGHIALRNPGTNIIAVIFTDS